MNILKGLLIVVLPFLVVSCSTTNSIYQPSSPIGLINKAPSSIENFVYSDSKIYPNESLGYLLRYRTKSNGLADVYVYPVPKQLATKPHDEIVKVMTSSAVADIKELENQGLYKNFNIIKQSYEITGQKTTGKVYATVVNKGLNTSTALYLTEDKGKLFKIRISEPNSELSKVQPYWNAFATDMFSFLTTYNIPNQ